MPGLITVDCGACGTERAVDDPVLVIRTTTIAPVLAVLPWEQLEDPETVIADFQSEVGTHVPAGPVIVPRELLPLLLTRDVDMDAGSPDEATTDVRLRFGEHVASNYGHFLALALEQASTPERTQLLHALLQVPMDDLSGWLDSHPAALSAVVIAELDKMVERAEAADDPSSVGLLHALRDMLDAVAEGVPSTDAVATFKATSFAQADQYLHPHLDALWSSARDDPHEEAILALRELLQRFPEPDGTGNRRIAAAMLGSRLLTSGTPDFDWVIELLDGVRASSPRRDAVWADATGNLAVTIGLRGTGDMVDNWRRSVALLRDALTAEGTDERAVAVLETNLGYALSRRPGGASQEELDEAIDWLERGLARRSPELDLEDWAYSKINLGVAYRHRSGPAGLSQAITHYRDAVDHLRGSGMKLLLTYAEVNLAAALRDADSAAQREAVGSAGAAVERTRHLGESFVLGWALRVLGDAHAAVDGPQAPAAIASWQESVDVLEPAVHPALVLDAGSTLAAAYSTVGAWEPLAALYERLLVAFDTLFNDQATTEARRQVLADYPRVARWAAYTFARVGRTAEAIEALERARIRELDVAARQDTADLDNLRRDDPGLADRYLDALAACRAVAARNRTQPAVPPPMMSTMDIDPAVRAATALETVINEIRAIPGYERFLATPTVIESLQEAGSSQAIYIVSAPAGTYVLRVVVAGKDETPSYGAAHLPITSRDVVGLLFFDADTGEPGLVLAQSVGPREGGRLFQNALARLESAFAPVITTVAGFAAESREPSVLVATGYASLIPLQSLPAADGSTLDDLAEIHLAPSLAVYAASRRRAGRSIAPILVGVADTQPDDPLPGTRGELHTIAARPEWASVAIAIGTDATQDWLRSVAAPGLASSPCLSRLQRHQ